MHIVIFASQKAGNRARSVAQQITQADRRREKHRDLCVYQGDLKNTIEMASKEAVM